MLSDNMGYLIKIRDPRYEYSRYAPDAPVELKLTAIEGQVIKCPAACISDAAGLPTTRCVSPCLIVYPLLSPMQPSTP